ncbi:MAG: DnaA N-terminal domain-containing protein [Pyrinomonadaceae bacterium]
MKLENQQLTVYAANQVVRDWVGENYAKHVRGGSE